MRLLFLLFSLTTLSIAGAQQGSWTGILHRDDGNNVTFTFDWKTERGKPVLYIKNKPEKIRVDNIIVAADSFIVQMPVFESQLRFVLNNGHITGVWIKGGALKTQVLSFSAEPGSRRFTSYASAEKNISGRWAVTFANNKAGELSVAEFVQKGNLLTGTFLNADGDDRYLEGIVTKDTLLLSGFDGGHAFLFKARIESSTTITNGIFYSGATAKQEWTATKNHSAKVSEESVAMYVKPVKKALTFLLKTSRANRCLLTATGLKIKWWWCN